MVASAASSATAAVAAAAAVPAAGETGEGAASSRSRCAGEDRLATFPSQDLRVDSLSCGGRGEGDVLDARRGAKGQGKAQGRVRKGKTRRDKACLLYTSPSPRDLSTSRMPSSA